ncbi:MAG: DUF4919 domain-containing protein [Terracidiphilus sp.]
MIRAQRLVFILLALFALPFFVAAQDSPVDYATLLAKLKAGDTNIDYGRLRLSYVDSPEYKQAKDVSKSEKAMIPAINAKEYKEALKDAEVVLANDYVNMDAHFVAFIANRELGATDKADFHRTVFRGLVDSIIHPGDGKSTEKAWVVINVDEEYVILRVLGFRPSGQSLINKDGHSYDEMKVKNVEDGTEQTFYFNVDISMKHFGV